ncbi:hypothetical protein SAMN05519103_00337 [Rhizobiales bacterium GAS113]|nr:hypothetical protein SAMN05519103_00337 [Rhizobiales bacterium GAS113]
MLEADRVEINPLQPAPSNPALVTQRPLSLTERKRLKPAVLSALTARMRLMIEFMVHGCPHQWHEAKTGIAKGTPLSLAQAADAVGIRRRNARDLFGQSLFQKELNRSLQALRDGHKAMATRKILDLVETKGDGKAADRKVQLEAALIVTGDAAKANSPSVNVNVVNQITPGYVIRLPAKREPATIEGKAIEVKP